jgi:hypothetical protein
LEELVAKMSRSQERQRAVRQVLVQMFEILLYSGMSEDEVRACSDACIASAKHAASFALRTPSKADDQDFGSILRSWHRQARYLSRDGSPKPLSLNGPHGLKALIGSYFPKDEILPRFAALKSAGLIAQNKSNRWIPTGRYALFPQLNNTMLDHLSEGVSRLVETIIGNVTTQNRADTLFERSARVRKFPESAAREFREFVKCQAVSFLATVDDWMEAQEELARSKRVRKCTAGVFTFAFMDEPSR